jgi:hypothetical protein
MTKTLLRVLLAATLFVAAGAARFWTAKRTVVSETRQYIGVSSPVETHSFELLEYRYRPILAWRSAVKGGRTAHVEHTYGAYIIQEMRGIEWCGSGRGVYVEAIGQYDSGESRRIRIFYDFQRSSLITTLDFRTAEAELDAAVSKCRVD